MSDTFFIDQPAQKHEPISIAATLSSSKRQFLATKVLAKSQPVIELSREHNVSRKFLYQQADKAKQALDNAFTTEKDDDKVLFTLPVTKEWLRQLVLSLTLSCHSSMRGIEEVFHDILDTPISIGTIHNIIRQNVVAARQVQYSEDLSTIRIGAHDEIFQNRKPILVGCDVISTYCYLLSMEDARDLTTWGVHLLDLQERGLRLNHSIADGGQGLRAAQAKAWPNTPCYGDVFHALRDMGQLSTYLENRACGAISTRDKLEQKIQRIKKHANKHTLSKELDSARTAEVHAITVTDNISVLSQWMQEDILSVAGHDLKTREQLYDWVVEELRTMEAFATHRIEPVRRKLQKGRDNLLSFVADIDQQLVYLSHEFQVPLPLIRALFEIQGIPETNPQRWTQEEILRHKIGSHFYLIKDVLLKLISTTVRASSVVENLNSRLRNYFFLRKQLGPEYLDLLRFFLNHRRFMRSEHPQRQGQSPAEILTGKEHSHCSAYWASNVSKKQLDSKLDLSYSQIFSENSSMGKVCLLLPF